MPMPTALPHVLTARERANRRKSLMPTISGTTEWLPGRIRQLADTLAHIFPKTVLAVEICDPSLKKWLLTDNNVS